MSGLVMDEDNMQFLRQLISLIWLIALFMQGPDL